MRLTGELDLATAPQLREVLHAAIEHAHLTVVDLGALGFIDCAGVHVLVDATTSANSSDRRLVIAPGPPHVDVLFALTQTRARLTFLHGSPPAEATPTQPRGDQYRAALPPIRRREEIEALIRPLDNPVNAEVTTARVMAVPDDRLWLQRADGMLSAAWTPGAPGPSGSVEVYLDARGQINGWREPESGLAVNQRRLDPGSWPLVGRPMVCQGACGVAWQAPAAAQLEAHDEHCLTCAGPLAPG